MKRHAFLLPLILLIPFLSFSQKYSAKYANKVLKGFCECVPNGKALIEGDTASVQAFFMSKREITNIDYLEFLADLKKNGEWEKYEIAKVDSVQWNNAFKNKNMQEMASTYHRHPAYKGYPVVNISKEAAELYCDWLSSAYDIISDGQLKLKFRIPTRAEYMRAARGDHHTNTYSWGGHSLRNEKGELLANFETYGDEYIGRDESNALQIMERQKSVKLNDGATIVASAESYNPNTFGFYNLNGNVAEMISDGDHVVGGDWLSPGFDIRNESIKKYTGPHPTVGFRVVASFIEEAPTKN